jgi:hypothetical protein
VSVDDVCQRDAIALGLVKCRRHSAQRG